MVVKGLGSVLFCLFVYGCLCLLKSYQASTYKVLFGMDCLFVCLCCPFVCGCMCLC